MAQRLYYFLLAALAYGLFSWVGLLLVIPPGFSSAIWPAAGLALGLYILMPTRAIVGGIWLGAFIVNLGIATQGFSQFSLPAVLMAVTTGTGATLQMLFGSWLFGRLLSTDQYIATPHDIFKFVLLISPLSCLIGSTIGMVPLYVNGFVSLANLPFSWLTWWVGDAIGLMLFTPLILTLLSTNQRLSNARKLLSLVPMTVIFSAILVLFFGSLQHHRQNQSTEMSELAQRLHLNVERRLRDSANKLLAYSAFFQASSYVSADDFAAFSATINTGDPTFQVVGWTPIVHRIERASVEADVRAQGFPDFTFTEPSPNGMVPAGPQDIYYPVVYIYPFALNKRAFGLNLGAIPSRLLALTQAFEQNQSVATAPIQLVQELDGTLGFILYLPVFRSTQLAFLSGPEKELLGYVGGGFRIGAVLRGAQREAEKIGIGIDLHDITDGRQPLQESTLIAVEGFEPVTYSLLFGQRHYQLTFFVSEKLGLYHKDWTSWIILTAGFLIAALLNSVILMLAATTENIRHEVARKTDDLMQATQAAIEANAAKSNFLANMSHEFRTPLNAIIGLNELCLMTPLTAQQSDYLGKSQMASNTLLGLINHTLDYEKIALGKLEVETTPFSLNNILDKMHAIFAIQAVQKGLYFVVTVPTALPETVLGDALRVEQVLLNLCSNAVKFTDQGGVTVELVVITRTLEHIALELTVSDTGIGISPDEQGHLFESFRQADASTARKYGGTGLGLNISRQLVDLMGGEIDVHSDLDVGSQFVVRLMFQITTADGRQIDAVSQNGLNVQQSSAQNTSAVRVYGAAIPSASPPDMTKEALKGLALLVVEDNIINRVVAEGLLRSMGAEITLAVDGFHALEILQSGADFDLILLDIQMPGMDGCELARKIRLLPGAVNELPLIAMTANVMDDDIARCLAAGMDDHIGKPLNIRTMVDKILARIG